MKKVITMVAAVAVAAVATADLTYFQYKSASRLMDNTGAEVANSKIIGGLAVSFTDLSGLVVDNGGQLQIDIGNITAEFTGNVGNLAAFLGGGFSADTISERPSAAIGQTAYFVFDLNGGGIAVGDFIGLGTGAEILDMAAAGAPAPADPQLIDPGAVTANIQVVAIPEPATLGLMGIAGLGLFLARKKARR